MTTFASLVAITAVLIACAQHGVLAVESVRAAKGEIFVYMLHVGNFFDQKSE